MHVKDIGMRIYLVGVVVAVLGLTALRAATDLSGNWHFVLNTPGGEREVSANFILAAEQVSGKWDTAALKGTFKDGNLELRFPYTSEEAGVTADFTIKGTLKDDKLIGRWQFSEWSGTFTATRVSSGL